MNTASLPRRRGLNPFLLPPGFSTYYTIGVMTQRRFPKFCTLDQVGREFGLTRQNAYTHSMVALGKFLYHLVKVVGEVPDLKIGGPRL